ncbi:MAG: leucine-rich repeat protein, partial [Paludibacteraceae bacterium]|nr:leucine-rich repeat protein [Paludibacteraceae bacterium]
MITFQNWCKWSTTLFLLLLSVFNCSAADWLCFTAEENGSTIWFENEGDNNPNMQYSLDGDSWYDWNDKVKITLENTNDKVYVRGDNPKGYSIKNTIYTHFGMDGKISASGSVMSLITKDESIIEIPNSNCFIKLFSDCKSLTQAPKLPATILKDSCYYTMFEKCESLAKAPELPAMTMTKDCYASMFRGCLSLTEAPSLPAMELATRCYSSMFSDCKNMEVAPELPATELAEACYSTMFTACEKLKKAPDLPAKKLANNCYFFMFERCSGIESAVISATELGKQSCIAMFMSCTSLKYIKVSVKTLDNDIEATEVWVSGVTSEGIIEFPCGSNYDKNGPSEAPINFTIKASPIVVFLNPDGTVLKTDTIECGTAPYYGEEPPFLDEEHEFVKWDKDLTVLDEPDIYYYTAIYKDAEAAPLGNWLCFTAEEAGSQVFYKTTGDKEPTIYYSFNGKNWDQLKYGETITLEEKGDKVYIKGDNPDGFSHSDEEYTTFFMYGRIAASGNVMSLIDGEGTTTKIPNSNCFRCLFKECQSLTKAPELPATELTQSCYAIMFAGCTSLTEAPELPATTLAASCYYYMFSDCISLKEAPALPATNLASACYFCTFINCENITKAPELPAETLKTHCYQGMFQDCKKLTEAPVLPAIEMEKNCYTDMFHGCTSLTKAPELPATTLAESCYYNMFKSTGLTEAPKLPAKTLQPSCYTKMFNGCTSLTKAPELPAQSLVESCYKEMFQGCTSLNYIKVGVMSLDNDFGATENWVDGIDGEGLFIFPCGSKYDKKGPSEVPQEFVIQSSPIVIFQNPDKKELWRDTIGCDVVPEYPFEEKGEPFYKEGLIFKGWDIEPHIHETPDTYYYTAVYGEEGEIDLNKILCFTALEPSSTISYGCMDVICPDLQFSRDSGKTWNSMEAYVEIKLDEGEKVYFRGNNPNGFSHGIDNYTYFTLNGRISASGSVMSLLDEKGELTEIPCDHCFSNLFNHCSLVDAPELPATKLTKGCYVGMFTSCYNLKKAPVLPAIEVKDHSYSSMFSGCISLTETPELPATVLGERCYYGMFAGCTGLTKAHDLPAMKLEKACYAYMFTSCQNLAVPPALPATELADSCYNYMFLTCNNITRAPLLPATTLKKGCYDHMFTACINLEIVPDFGATVTAENSCDGMFISCINLKKAPALPATELDENCYHLMFAGCSNLLEAPELPATVMKNSCYESMFNSCISLKKAPELPAEVLANGCYKEMFVGCGKLNYIKVGITTLDNEFNATENWVNGVDGPGVFIFPCGSTYNKHGVSEVPDSFKIISSPIVIFQNPDST